MLQIIQFIVSFIAIVALGLLVLKRFQKGEYISYLTLFALFAIVDVFIPGVIGALSGQYLIFHYFESASETEWLLATIIYTFAILLFALGWKISNKKVVFGKQYKGAYTISERMLSCAFWLPVIIRIANLYIEYRACGSFAAFYEYKITRAYLVTIEYNSLFEKAIQFASEFTPNIMFIALSIGFVNAKKLKHKFFWSIIAPLVSLVMCVLSLYRGTFLTFGCALIVSLQFRTDLMSTFREKIRTHKRIFRYGILIAIVFFVYGAYRTQLNAERWDVSINFVESLIKTLTNTFGTSLSALTRCITYLSSGGEVFAGRSIYEMFYFFIPRSIWPGKPTHYGIVSLTTAMGSPTTTMDAVTIPGELLMNFGLLGILFIPIIGFIFKRLEMLKHSVRYKYLYAATISTMVTTSMWMSFTGFFAQIKYFPIYIIAIMLIIRKDRGRQQGDR